MTCVLCPEGHRSDEPDYCSVCGAAIAQAAAPAPAASPTAKSPPAQRGEPCPVCGEPRADTDARFCEVCRYDFVGRSPGAAPQRPAAPAPRAPSPPAPAPAPLPTASPGPPGASPFSAGRRWELVLSVDPSLDTEPDPETPCPAGQAPVTLPLDRAELLVGRRDDRRDIRPDIPLNDPGASRRHAKFVLGADGGVLLQDLASTNGSKINGVDVVPGSRRALANGDEVTIGRWTRILVRGVGP